MQQWWHLLGLEHNSDCHDLDKASCDAATRRQPFQEVDQLHGCKGSMQPHLNWSLDPPLETPKESFKNMCLEGLDEQLSTSIEAWLVHEHQTPLESDRIIGTGPN